ncbi:MAG: FAD-binding protein, partial [Planctomycetota bacterium]|nr:FAD-binding protein [Planctomycetota bacterium]
MSNIQINAADQIVDVSCSTAVADLQQALNEHSLMLGVLHDPDSELSVGELFMNGGHNLWRGAFGYLRDQVLAGSWALNDGDQISTGARVVKSVAGYDLTRLLLGSHDHLASCESLCLRLHPAFKRRHFYSIELAQYLQYSHFDLNPCSAFQAADGNIIISSHFELKREYLTA